MQISRIRIAISLVLTCSAAGCGGKSPAAPDPVVIPAGTHQSAITPVTGTGAGGVSVSPKSIAAATFDADIAVAIVNARPNTTYFVQRAPEIGRTNGSDGICQRALGISPWSAADPAAPAFITFTQPNAGPAITMTTSATGSATIRFEFLAPTIPTGTVFDVMFRLVDNEAAPTLELRSACFTVTVK
jgi:hypothetical protein